MKNFLLAIIFLLGVGNLFGQKYLTQTGTISFFSEAPMENIEATNNQVSSVMDLSSGKIAFSLLISAFNFEKAMMQEHFNEKYMESVKFPKSTFNGQFVNPEKLLTLTDSPSELEVSGTLTIHGTTKQISTMAMVQKTGDGSIEGQCVFNVKADDFGVNIPTAKKDNISNDLKVTVKAKYEKTD